MICAYPAAVPVSLCLSLNLILSLHPRLLLKVNVSHLSYTLVGIAIESLMSFYYNFNYTVFSVMKYKFETICK